MKISASLACLAVALGFFAGPVCTLRSQTFRFITIAGIAGQQGTNDGVNNSALFYQPGGIALDNQANLYVADWSALRSVTHAGADWIVTTLSSQEFEGFGIAVDNAGTVYLADITFNAIKRASQSNGVWTVSLLAGGSASGASRDGLGTFARFYHPYALAVDSSTNIFVADTDNNTIRKISPVGTDWLVTTIAGLAGSNGTVDGTNTNARFFGPTSIALDAAGNLYVTEYWAHTIRMLRQIGTNWVVSTLAGHAGSPGSNDGTNSDARFNNPSGIAADTAGNLYIADSFNHTIRQVAPQGTNWVVTTIGGLAGVSGSADGDGTNALFHTPSDVTIDAVGNLYVADFNNLTLRLGRPSYLLSIEPVANQVVVSWPLTASNFVLETTSILSPDALWTPLTNGIISSGDRFKLTAPTQNAGFYRLRKGLQ